MHLPHVLLLAGALSATAHPSGHAHQHLHRSAHVEERAGPVFVKNVRPALPKPASSAVTVAAASSVAAPKPSAAAPVPAAAAAQSDTSSDSDEYIPFCSGSAGIASRDERTASAVKEKRVTEAQVMYTGNLGTNNGCPWNSNMMLVPNKIADKYTYVQKYKNVASEDYEVICANKMGVDRQLTGMFEVAGQKPLKFNLAPGETKTLVMQPDTQAVCAFAPKSVPKTPFGQYAGNWAETDSGNASNGGWSGADCSSLVAQHYDMDVPGCQICSQGTCSTIWPGGKGDNAYTKGMEALDGVGLNLNVGKYVMEILVGYS